MKKITLALALVLVSLSTMAITRTKVREYARFLSDRMAYELNLTSMQYDDCYEINYDFVSAVGDLLDDVVYGYSYATEEYYTRLDYRNEDLSYVLTPSQYSIFIASDCFYRPFCINDGVWAFRPYMIYSNRSYFYRDVPVGYYTYRGAHGRFYFSTGFYVDRYNHGPRPHFEPIRRHHDFDNYHRRDFGRAYPGRGHDYAPARRDNRYDSPRRDNGPRDTYRPGNNRRDDVRQQRTEPRRERTEQRQERTEPRQQRTEQRQERTEPRQQRTEQRQERTESRPQRQERTESRQQPQQRGGGGGGVSSRGRR